MNDSVRAGYEELGIEGYYKRHCEDYSNPHISIIKELIDISNCIQYLGNNILDLCCGSGEITNILKDSNFNIEGLDPYTAPAYKKNTGKECLVYDFKDIVQGALQNRRYDTIICSYAMHLCEESMLNNLLYQLSLIANTLIIITPHKRPEVKNWWKEIESFKHKGITLKIYRTKEFGNE